MLCAKTKYWRPSRCLWIRRNLGWSRALVYLALFLAFKDQEDLLCPASLQSDCSTTKKADYIHTSFVLFSSGGVWKVNQAVAAEVCYAGDSNSAADKRDKCGKECKRRLLKKNMSTGISE
jgi:hypothetical protein